MTNKQYHRRARALIRLDASARLSAMRAVERERLRVRVTDYGLGGERCMNGSGSTRHKSGASA